MPRFKLFAIALLPGFVLAAPTWQVITTESGRRIELDRTSIQRADGGKVTAVGRTILEKEITDIRSGGAYRIIEALTRYDCAGRTAATLKRSYWKTEDELLREEAIGGDDLPVRTGTLDDRILREVCRPADGQTDAQTVVSQANAAAAKLRAANEALVREEVARKEKSPSGRRKPVGKRSTSPVPVPAPIEWSYQGESRPENWHKLDPRYAICASGRRQSPIDVRDGIRVDLEAIRFAYPPATFSIVDTGKTVQVIPGAGSFSLTGKTYNLIQMQFHLPAEVTVDGRRHDMAAHLVHRSVDGQLAVVVVFFERGNENPVVQTLWNYLPLERGMPVSPPQVAVDLEGLLPANRMYSTFMGSLTTPPCTEGVLWLVLKQPVQVSAEQLEVFARLYRNNIRPLQNPAGRLIKEGR